MSEQVIAIILMVIALFMLIGWAINLYLDGYEDRFWSKKWYDLFVAPGIAFFAGIMYTVFMLMLIFVPMIKYVYRKIVKNSKK